MQRGGVLTLRRFTPSNAPLQDPLLRPEEAARLLSVRTSWIYEAVRVALSPSPEQIEYAERHLHEHREAPRVGFQRCEILVPGVR